MEQIDAALDETGQDVSEAQKNVDNRLSGGSRELFLHFSFVFLLFFAWPACCRLERGAGLARCAVEHM